jgi:homoserine kinase
VARHWIEVFAPATVANLGPGYDLLGLALEAPGDRVRARLTDDGLVRLIAIHGEGKLPSLSADNTACVAARRLLELSGVSWGLEFELFKGLPIGSGLGSSGASAVAAAVALAQLLLAEGIAPLSADALLGACAAAEASACGAAHYDNVAPALLGGVCLVRPGGRAIRLETKLDLFLSLITPALELPTRLARQAIPALIPVTEALENNARLATLTYALARGDRRLLDDCFIDRIAEPRRVSLMPFLPAVQEAALSHGAFGCSISGAGPSIFAICDDRARAEAIKSAMGRALDQQAISHRAWVSAISPMGARVVQQGEER